MTDELNKEAPGTQSSPDETLREHVYDGIQEYDNPMPAWWLWILWATIVFTPVYILGAHVFDFIPSYEEDLAASQEELSAIRGAFESVNQPFEVTAETMAEYIGVQDQIDAGAATYATNCLMCHGDKGQGLIGPNLTDQYWIHGGADADLFNVITSGVPVKGMTPWGNILSQEQRAQVVAYIRSLQGSNPSGGKGPEGELFEQD